MHVAPHQAALFEICQHLGHRRRLHALAGSQFAGAHRTLLGKRRHGRELGECDGQIDPLITDDSRQSKQ
jgi:hypothetical protein